VSDYRLLQQQNPGFAVDSDVAAADTAKASIIVAKDANHSIYIQKITVSVITDAAQSLIFQDTGAPLIIGKTKASPGLGPIVFDFGVVGTKLTVGKDFSIATSGAGIAARVHVEGYQRKTGVDYVS
jgi:hypothetical protein